MDRAGIATDAVIRSSIEVRERRNGYTVIRTPEVSDYWFANYLLLDKEPQPEIYDFGSTNAPDASQAPTSNGSSLRWRSGVCKD